MEILKVFFRSIILLILITTSTSAAAKADGTGKFIVVSSHNNYHNTFFNASVMSTDTTPNTAVVPEATLLFGIGLLVLSRLVRSGKA